MINVYILTFSKGLENIYYIGRSANFDRRIKKHLYQLSNGTHHNLLLQSKFNEGFEYNSKHLIPCETLDEAKELETALIRDNLNCPEHVNIECAGNTLTNNPNRNAIKSKIKSTLLATYSRMTNGQKKILYGRPGKSNGMYGKTHTLESRDKIKAKLKKFYENNVSILKGRKLSAERRKQISDRAKLRVGNKNPFYGKQHSESTKRKLSEANKGNKPTNMTPVNINGVSYESLREASNAINVPVVTVRHRVLSNNPKFATWIYE